MRLLGNLLTVYRKQSTTLVLALLFATLLEGVSLTALLPTLGLVFGESDGEQTTLGQWADQALSSVGLTPSLSLLLTIIVIGIILKNALLLYANRRVGYIAAQITTDLRLELLRAVMKSKWSYFIHQSVGQMANAMAAETMRITEAFIFGTRLLATVVQALVYAFVAVTVSWQATVFCLVASFFIVFVSQGLVRMSKKAGQQQTMVHRSLMGRLTDVLQSVKPFKAMERGEVSNRVLEHETMLLNKALRKQVFGRAALDSAQEPLFAIFLCLGIYLAITQASMAVSTVVVMALVAGKLATIIGDIQKQYQKMVVRESAYWSVRERIEAAEAATENLPAGNLVEFSKDIELRDVRFAYGQNKVLQGLSMHVPYGSMTTLIGPSGSGKTTIIDLLVGLVRPDSGEVVIDGQPLEQVDLRAWRRQVGYVPQENLLLHYTVAKNISLGEEDVTEADIEYALRAAGAWEFVAGLEDGLETVAGERGARFSGGQRQRIMLARALVHHPRLLILDEATSALDPETEAAICRTLAKLKGQVTILAVTHQSALAEVSDRVYRVVDGRFEEETAPSPRVAES